MTSPADRIPSEPSSDPLSDEGKPDETPQLDINQNSSEKIEFERVEQGLPKRRKGLSPYWLVLTIFILAGGSWVIWAQFVTGPNPDEVPLVKAPDGPYKVKPSTPGGMPIPNRDKTVYDTFGKNTLRTATKRLVPKPEQPLLAPEPNISVLNEKKRNLDTSAPTLDTSAPTKVENLFNSSQSLPKRPITKFEEKSEVGVLRTPIAPKISPSKSRSLENIKIEESKKLTISGIPSSDVRNDATKRKQSPKLKSLTPASSPIGFSENSFQIQLAAVRLENAAIMEWRRLKTRHNEFLGSLKMKVVRADLGSKGIYYRLRAGPIEDKRSAKELCKELTKVRVKCIVVRPGK